MRLPFAKCSLLRHWLLQEVVNSTDLFWFFFREHATEESRLDSFEIVDGWLLELLLLLDLLLLGNILLGLSAFLVFCQPFFAA